MQTTDSPMVPREPEDMKSPGNLDEEDNFILKTCGLRPYSTRIKKAEKEGKDNFG